MSLVTDHSHSECTHRISNITEISSSEENTVISQNIIKRSVKISSNEDGSSPSKAKEVLIEEKIEKIEVVEATVVDCEHPLRRVSNVLIGIVFFSFAAYFYSLWMMAVTFLLSIGIVYLPPGKYKDLALQIGTACSMLLPLLGVSVMERIRMTGHGIVLLLKVWDFIVEHRDNPQKKEVRYSLKQILFYFFHPMSDLPPRKLATFHDIKITFIDSIIKFLVLGCFVLMGYVIPTFISELYLVKNFLGLVYFYLTIDALIQFDGVVIMWLTGWYVPPMFHYPFLSQSPRDFWSRRWNMMVHNFVHKHIFIPMKKAGLPSILSVICIGLFTSVLHEYVVLFSAMSFEQFGQMSIFFLIHVFASIFQVILFKIGFWSSVPLTFHKVVNIMLHSLWFIVTAPLFLRPFFSTEITLLVNEVLQKSVNLF
jgi:hypothetical protein